jgi:hypothetical protein
MIANHDQHIKNDFDPEDDYHQMKADMYTMLKGQVSKSGVEGLGDALRLFASSVAPPNRRLYVLELWSANAERAQTGQHTLVKPHHPMYLQQRTLLQDVSKSDQDFAFEDEKSERSEDNLWEMSGERHALEDEGCCGLSPSTAVYIQHGAPTDTWLHSNAVYIWLNIQLLGGDGKTWPRVLSPPPLQIQSRLFPPAGPNNRAAEANPPYTRRSLATQIKIITLARP